jgi:hypothetical protein
MLSVTYKPFMLSVVMLSVVMLSVIMLSVIMLSVVMKSVIAAFFSGGIYEYEIQVRSLFLEWGSI